MSGCAVGPDYHGPPHTNVPVDWKTQAPWKEGHPRDAEIKQNFWEVFDDPVLTGLELEATTNSPDIQAAFERVEQARAVARITRADLYPGLSLDPNGNRTHYSANRTTEPGPPAIGYTGNDFFLPLDLSYEVDLWGRVRRSFRAAREQAQGSAAAYQNVLLSLQADVAQTYFMIRSVDLDRRVVAQTIDLRQKNLTLVESLHRGGADSAVDLAEAQTELASAQADLVGLDLQRAQLENSLAVFCGQMASTFSLAETSRFYRPPRIPVGLPADLLERRPDVAEAERSMAAASEGIGIAKAAFFPAIQLTATAGTESVDLRDIFSWESRAWSFGPNITLPLFEGGRNRAGLQQSKAAYQEAIAQYRSQVLVAFHEVEDGLVGLHLLEEQFNAQMRAVDAAKQVADLSRLRYKEGLASYFEVVINDRTMLENEIAAYELNGQRLVTTVMLIKALGGGWKPNNPMMTNGVAPLQKVDYAGARQ
ncbi:MAG TPA: efflux transporter outer membrane subunit [Candidatus Baltobacteraceae bacterium]|jgi:multidrug efflux system outer membrane protein|nr:efflux transporter outer membrane subunit [Candidatus Baltobacteraceae bacterium]